MIPFDDYFLAVHGHKPFPWQSMLAKQVIEHGWPESIDLPTASGKTATIDIGVWALASAPPEHPQPRRMFFVVDRRIVVDEVVGRATRISERLLAASTDEAEPLHGMATRLLEFGGEIPLQVASLRGGVYLDHGWARTPVQPLVCASTVDQVGSRLLFRGYGLPGGDGNQLPIHAGLVGNDSLIILDEAHLSQPFDETLDAVRRYRKWSEAAVATPWRVVRMSATLPDGALAFPHSSERDRALDDPILRRRFEARKVATLDSVVDEAFPSKLVERAVALGAEDRSGVVGIVVNRVATARRVFERLEEAGDRVLLIGRSRPVDRDRILSTWLPRMRAGRERTNGDSRLFVVSTQCIEVGADLDFDALVTEIAPLDSLRQRFGRLDRLGELGETRAAIVASKSSIASKEQDPVYGAALAATWRWLESLLPRGRGVPQEIDFGVTAMEASLASISDLDSLLAPRASAPVLLPAHVDQLSWTSPRPAVEPEPALYLHGPDAGAADIQIVWRSDLGDDPRAWAEIVSLVPPRSTEALQVRRLDLLRWLDERSVDDHLTDVEGAAEEDSGERPQVTVLRWRGPADPGTRLIDAHLAAPGDTLVVPAAVGGIDEFGWNPASVASVADRAEAAAVAVGRPVVRLHPAVAGSTSAIDDILLSLESGNDVRALVDGLLESLSTSSEEADVARAAALVLEDVRRHWSTRAVVRYPDGSGVAVVGRRRSRYASSVTDEDDATSLGRQVTLGDHTAGVAGCVRRFAESVALPPLLVADLVLAARLHDLGKVDPRFQAWLYGGDHVAATAAAEPIAKSGLRAGDRTARRIAREIAGYPPRYRHEGASIALAESHDAALASAHDPELVLHLVASHHGHARPFLPPALDDAPVGLDTCFDGARLRATSDHGLGEVGSGIADRFFAATRRYGWWGLALIEAILRLADHRVSEAEEGA